jgi:hypothetical protein
VSNAFSSFAEGTRQLSRTLAIAFEKVKCDTLRRFLPHAGHASERVD